MTRARRRSSAADACVAPSRGPLPRRRARAARRASRPGRGRAGRGSADQTRSTRADDAAAARRLGRAGRGQHRPGAEIGDDARAAREREQREDEADERDGPIASASAMPAADACKHAVALHARDARERDREPEGPTLTRRTTSSRPSPTRASSTSIARASGAAGSIDSVVHRGAVVRRVLGRSLTCAGARPRSRSTTVTFAGHVH